jgi:hypothetical protein
MCPLELSLSMRDTFIDNTNVSSDTISSHTKTEEGTMALVP